SRRDQAQNLPVSDTGQRLAVEAQEANAAGAAAAQNLPTSAFAVDSAAPIDNDSNISSKLSSSPPPQKSNKTTVTVSSDIDSTAAPARAPSKQKQPVLAGCR